MSRFKPFIRHAHALALSLLMLQVTAASAQAPAAAAAPLPAKSVEPLVKPAPCQPQPKCERQISGSVQRADNILPPGERLKPNQRPKKPAGVAQKDGASKDAKPKRPAQEAPRPLAP